MEKTSHSLQYSLTRFALGLVIGILIMLWINRCNRINGSIIDPITQNGKTDTLVKLRYVHDTVKVPYQVVKTEVVTLYRDKPQAPPGTKIVYTDTGSIKVVYKDRPDTINIDEQFLFNYPTSPKLLTARIFKSKFQADLYYINNEVKNQEWPMDLDKYDYVWEDEVFKAVTKKKPKEKIRGTSEMSALYDPLNQAARLELDYTLRYKRFGLMARPFALWQKEDGNVKGGVETGIRVKLK